MNPRRDAIDVARVLALTLVVVGHLALAVIDTVDGEVRGANLLELRPGWAWIAVVAPMPVFFAAAGWANATATSQSAAPRLRALVGTAAVVVGSWAALVIAAVAITGEAGVVGDGARIATQPLWFVAAYAPMAAAGHRLAALAVRCPGLVLGACLAVLAALDLLRFGLGWPSWIGWPGFYLAWGVPWLAGSWWRVRASRGVFDERRTGIAMLVGAGGAAVALVHLGGYAPSLIDVVPGARSNTTPPTLYTAIAGLAQVGFLLIAAATLDRLGARWRSLWDRAGEVAVGVYLWHLTGLALCGAVVAAGLPVPSRLTGAWWATRPLWFAGVLAITLGLVGATAAGRGALHRRSKYEQAERLGSTQAVLGVVVAAGAAAAVGLEGPRSVTRALAWTGMFVVSWLLLRARVQVPTRWRRPQVS